MSITRLTVPEISGTSAAWDSASPDDFKEVAGENFIKTSGDNALVRTSGGYEMEILSGWFAIRSDDGTVNFVTPEVAARGAFS